MRKASLMILCLICIFVLFGCTSPDDNENQSESTRNLPTLQTQDTNIQTEANASETQSTDKIEVQSDKDPAGVATTSTDYTSDNSLLPTDAVMEAETDLEVVSEYVADAGDGFVIGGD